MSTTTPVKRAKPKFTVNLRQYGILAALAIIIILFQLLTDG